MLWKKYFTAAAARVNQSSAFFIYTSWGLGPEAWEESPFPKWSRILSSAFFSIQALDKLFSLP